MFFVLLALATGAAPAPVQPSFTGVTLGQTAAQLVAERGDPLGDREQSGESVYLYLTPDGNLEQFIHIKAGRVLAVAVSATPPQEASPTPPPTTAVPSALGVTLGDPAAALAAIRKDRLVRTDQTPDGPSSIYSDNHGLFYGFLVVNGKVAQITAQMSNNWMAFLGPSSARPAIHDGASLADAIVIKATNEEAGVRAEYAYLALHACDASGAGKWIAPQQSLVSSGGKNYDKVSARCSVNNFTRDFYFDVSSFFGKT
jgi:hypothetical protein